MKKALFFLLTSVSLSADPEAAVLNRKSTMENISDQKLIQQTSVGWLAYLKELTSANKAGQFAAKDKFGMPVILEWEKTDIRSPVLAAFKRTICELACQVLVPIEVEFLQAHPNAVSQELFLKSCAPFFEKGTEAVDWNLVEEKIHSTMRQFYLTDIASFGEAMIKPLLDDAYFLVTIKDKERGKTMGFSIFAITPALAYGHVKVINIAVAPEEQGRGLEQVLMSSIFKIIPEVKRVFLFTRPTNGKALEDYRRWGFTQDLSPTQDPNHKVNLDYLVLLEYKIEQSDTLQKIAVAQLN